MLQVPNERPRLGFEDGCIDAAAMQAEYTGSAFVSGFVVGILDTTGRSFEGIVRLFLWRSKLRNDRSW
jgi:hypothetical protein